MAGKILMWATQVQRASVLAEQLRLVHLASMVLRPSLF